MNVQVFNKPFAQKFLAAKQQYWSVLTLVLIAVAARYVG
jgi:hypothetical protein